MSRSRWRGKAGIAPVSNRWSPLTTARDTSLLSRVVSRHRLQGPLLLEGIEAFARRCRHEVPKHSSGDGLGVDQFPGGHMLGPSVCRGSVLAAFRVLRRVRCRHCTFDARYGKSDIYLFEIPGLPVEAPHHGEERPEVAGDDGLEDSCYAVAVRRGRSTAEQVAPAIDVQVAADAEEPSCAVAFERPGITATPLPVVEASKGRLVAQRRTTLRGFDQRPEKARPVAVLGPVP